MSGIEVLGPLKPGYDQILTKDCLAFLAELHRKFNQTRLSMYDMHVI